MNTEDKLPKIGVIGNFPFGVRRHALLPLQGMNEISHFLI